MPKPTDSQLSAPFLSEGSDLQFSVGSNLGDLPLHHFQADRDCLSLDVARVFEKYPLVPGVILVEKSKFYGMISRQRFLEYLLLPKGRKLFLKQSLDVLYRYARTEILVLPEQIPIVEAAGLAFRRSPKFLSEPVVVKAEAENYWLLDVHYLNRASWQIRGIEAQVRYERAQAHMIQTEKMASLGRLVEGVAHEILDPVNFIWGNLKFVSSYHYSLLDLLAAYEKHFPELPLEIVKLKEEMEFDYLQTDLPRSLESIQKGAERLKNLTTSLQNFCNLDRVYQKPANLHACLDGILLLLKSRIQSEIEIVKNYGYLPPVKCFVGQLSQVFINIITNAVDVLLNQAVAREFAVERMEGKYEKDGESQKLEITTRVCPRGGDRLKTAAPRWVSIKFADNGPGLSPQKLQQIRESFSVEKRMEKETSLAVSYQIITSQHGGRFEVRSQLGEGTEFEILLPLG